MNKKWLAIMLLAGLFTTAGAVAQEKTVSQGSEVKAGKGEQFQGKSKEKLEKIDTDGDGKISKTEAEKAPKGKLKEHFAEIDTNKDNYLDKEEMKAYKQAKKVEKREKKQKQ